MGWRERWYKESRRVERRGESWYRERASEIKKPIEDQHQCRERNGADVEQECWQGRR
jgi:hypothetical protein